MEKCHAHQKKEQDVSLDGMKQAVLFGTKPSNEVVGRGSIVAQGVLEGRTG